MEEFLITILIWISGFNPNLGSTYTIEQVSFADTNSVYSLAFTQEDESCMECHKEVLEPRRKHAPVKESCAKCHQPNGKEHPLDGVKGFNLVKQVPDLCFKCHDNLQAGENPHQAKLNNDCKKCHEVHASKNKMLLTQKKAVTLCNECHELEIPETDVIHNPVKSGRCNKCHDPHNNEFGSFLKQKSPDLCYRCHDGVAEEMKLRRKHTAAKENCFNCHDPHSNKQSYLLPDTIPNLCFKCHDNLQTGKNPHQEKLNNDCKKCHAVHASKNKMLLTQKKAVTLCNECHELEIPETDVIHNPVKSGRCNKCHDPHNNEFGSFLKQKSPDLCYRCHDGVAEEMKLRRKHTAAKENCFNCHDPHSNKQSYLLPDTLPNLCFKCHDNLQAGENPHQSKLNNDCKKCHAVHASKNKMLLTQKKAVTLCNECHQLEIPESNTVHNPVSSGRCNKCHDPHKNEFGSFLKNDMPNLCYRCHEGVEASMGMVNLHQPAKEDCFKCHKPHDNTQSYLLPDTIPNLCYSCHQDFQQNVQKATRVHKVLNDSKSCGNCHSPHGSPEKGFLKKKEKEVCLDCHDRVYMSDDRTIMNIKKVIENAKSVHGPINFGCSSCHNPHYSERMDLLVNNFPVGAYAPVTKENFALCFDCHTSEIIEQEYSKTATNFRDGDKNLHFVHTNGNRGRNCTTCHDIHAAANKHLISEKVPYGKWEMPMNYKSNENGGSCFPGCHQEEKYDRR